MIMCMAREGWSNFAMLVSPIPSPALLDEMLVYHFLSGFSDKSSAPYFLWAEKLCGGSLPCKQHDTATKINGRTLTARRKCKTLANRPNVNVCFITMYVIKVTFVKLIMVWYPFSNTSLRKIWQRYTNSNNHTCWVWIGNQNCTHQ